MKASTLAILLAVFTTVLSVVVGVQAGMLYARGWRVAWGNAPEWVAAFGTVVAIIAVLVAALGYRLDVRTRTEDEHQRTLTKRRQQAELVSGWFVHFGSVHLSPQIGDEPRQPIKVTRVGLINASQVVVYDLFAVAVCRHSTDVTPVVTGPPVQTKQPDGTRVITVGMGGVAPVEWDQRRDRIAAGWLNVVQPGDWTVEIRLASPSASPDGLHLFFRDHQGVYWWRHANGALNEVLAPGPELKGDRQAQLRRIEQILGEDETDAQLTYLMLKPLKVDRQ